MKGDVPSLPNIKLKSVQFTNEFFYEKTPYIVLGLPDIVLENIMGHILCFIHHMLESIIGHMLYKKV